MITVILNKAEFEYDVHSLVKAFYPGEDVKVSVSTDTFSLPSENADIIARWGEDELVISLPARDISENIPLRCGGDRLYRKNCIKQGIYRLLSKALNKKLPWGALTGIRPTRLAMDRLYAGYGEEETRAHMMEIYYVSPEKAGLCVDIAKREKDIIEREPYREGYSLYIGIPFCPTTCMYCSFASYNIGAFENKVDEYLDHLITELVKGAGLFKNKKLYSIYMGGGTPTSLSPKRLDRVLRAVSDNYGLDAVKEFTVEAGRPDSITKEKLQVLLNYGITRISVNPQSMNQKTLDIIGRRHSVEDTIRAYYLARDMGFDNINMDIILGLLGEDISHIEHTMEEILKLKPDSLTIHSLSVKRASKLSEYITEMGREGLNNSDAMMDTATRYAVQMGLKPYYLYRQKNMTGNLENTGYAREGRFGIYNILMMEEIHDILACGAGTISKKVFDGGRIERSENVKDLKNYLERFDEMLLRKERLFSGV